MKIQTSVRVRPFSELELCSSSLCVSMELNKTRLYNSLGQYNDFTFDHAFWSHNQFNVNQAGQFTPNSDKYADQKLLFEKIGKPMLTKAWQGYHGCLLAYGQIGSGKSYTMIGNNANKGIIPLSCEEIFKQINANQDQNLQIQVNVSMIEIYNQKVYNLLIPILKRPKQGYKIRQHPTEGIYIQRLQKHWVNNQEAMMKIINKGLKNRNMNNSSSRSHVIILIQLKLKKRKLAQYFITKSVIKLVDLAGKEKNKKTQNFNSNIKESSKINNSILNLRNVIYSLRNKSYIPYKSSALTRILKNSLGGNSKTSIIITISPSSNNYEQNLSALRFGLELQQVKNMPEINEISQAKHLEKLIQKVKFLQKQIVQIEKNKNQQLQQFNQELRFTEQLICQINQEYKINQIKQQQQSEKQQVLEFYRSIPHLSKLSPQISFNRKANIIIDKQLTTIGQKDTIPQNDIQLKGTLIRAKHAIITKQHNKYYITPINFYEYHSQVYLNGYKVSDKKQITNLDRISIGTYHIYIVMLPGTQPRQIINEKDIDWDYAYNQVWRTKRKQQAKQQQERIKQKQVKQSFLQPKSKDIPPLNNGLVYDKQIIITHEIEKLVEIYHSFPIVKVINFEVQPQHSQLPISNKGIKQLAYYSHNIRNIKVIDLSYNAFNSLGFIQFCEKCCKFPQLATMKLDGNQIKDTGFISLIQNSSKFSNLQNISMSQTKITNQSLIIFAKNGANFSKLLSIDITKNNNLSQGFQFLVENINSFQNLQDICCEVQTIEQAKFLGLNYYRLTKLKAIYFYNAFSCNSNLMAFVQSCLTLPNLKVIKLINAKVVDQGLKLLVENGFKFPNLQIIYLSSYSQSITDSGIKFIADNSSKVPNLKQISFDKTQITDEGFKHFIVNSKFLNLQKIQFCRCSITDAALICLADNNFKLSNLQVINLSANQITDQGLKYFSINSSNFPNLKAIILMLCRIKNEGLKNLAENGLKFPQLQKIILDYNPITAQGLKFLIDTKFLPNLKQINIKKNKCENQRLWWKNSILPQLSTAFPNQNYLMDNMLKCLVENGSKFPQLQELYLGHNLRKSKHRAILKNFQLEILI